MTFTRHDRGPSPRVVSAAAPSACAAPGACGGAALGVRGFPRFAARQAAGVSSQTAKLAGAVSPAGFFGRGA